MKRKQHNAERKLLFTLALAAATICSAQAPSTVELVPPSSRATQRWTLDIAREPTLSREQKLRLVRDHIKYVFVLFEENRSFDFYFGTYPGADGIYSRPVSETAGFKQPIVNVDGTVGTISPFRIPASIVDRNGKTVPLYPEDVASVNHSHVAIARKLDLDKDGVARNDEYALTEEGVKLVDGKPS
jgi:phospholipase C